jgi:ParB-like chromosome segregation protein Spo0J
MAKKAAKKKTQKLDVTVAAAPRNNEPAIHCRHDELVPLVNLRPHPANPSRHPEAQVKLLAQIIKAHGIRHSIVVSKNSGFIVSGHCRLMAAQELGLKAFPVTLQSYAGESEELAVLVADNKIAELSEIDGSKMGDIIVELDQQNYPLELTALSLQEITSYVEGPIYPPDGKEYDENIETKNKCPKCGYEW